MAKRKSYIDADGDAVELDEEFFKTATRGRPPMPEDRKKVRVNLMLAPDVLARLRAEENMSATVDSALRKEFGLQGDAS